MNDTCRVSYPETKSTSLKSGSDRKPIQWQPAMGQHILFHFMCRWSCSNCWKSLLALGRLRKQTVGHNISVVVVGTSRYLRPATNLAAQLDLPFTFLADDTGALRRAYGLGQCDHLSHDPAIVLVDSGGLINFRQAAMKNGIIGVESELLSAMETLPAIKMTSVA